MLRDLPDARLPRWNTNDEGVAEISLPANEEVWTRAVTADRATPWTRVAAAAREVRLAAVPALPLRVSLRGEDGAPVVRARVALLPQDCTRLCPERLLAFDEKNDPATFTTIRGAVYRAVIWSESHAPVTRSIAATGDITLALPPGGALGARLVDGERKPVRGSTLEVQYRLSELSEVIRRVRDGAGQAVAGAKVLAKGSSFARTDGKGVALLQEVRPPRLRCRSPRRASCPPPPSSRKTRASSP